MVATSPISNLNNDIFLSIFDTITARIPDKYDSRRTVRPLVVVQNASQVCRRWRELLLGSSWIWGRLIDLYELIGRRLKIEWLEEIFRRAGSAPLWIFGSVVVVTEDYPHLFRLLDCWERIEKLVVEIISTNNIPDDIHARFSAPAPVLKTFEVCFRLGGKPIFLKTLKHGLSESLFSDHAPSLRTIRADLVAFRLNSPWLSNIREIKYFPPNITLNDIFFLLQHTPVIETIILCSPHLVWKQADPPRHKFNLPCLSSIKIWTNLPAAATILEYILPGRLSTVYINIEHVQVELYDSSTLSGFKQNFARYIANYFTANPPQAVLIEPMTKNSRFCDVTHCTRHDLDMPYLEINLSYVVNDRIWDSIAVCFIDALIDSLSPNPSILKSIKQLRLPELQVEMGIIPRLYSLLALFRDVRVIWTNEEHWGSFCALSTLDDAGGDPRHVLFPKLHTLRVGRDKKYERFSEALYMDLTQFITGRNRLGFPLAKLDLTRRHGKKSYHEQDIFCLETVDGLEVVWRPRTSGHSKSDEIRSYICGTGIPERLRGLTIGY